MLFIEDIERKNAKNLTVIDKIVINYIKTDPHTILELTIDEFANQCTTTKSSIVKTLQKIGISGFKELKIKLMNAFKSNDPNYSSSNVCKETINNLLSTDLLLKGSPLTEVAKLIVERKNVNIIGGGSLAHLGAMLSDQFNKLGIYSVAISVDDSRFWTLNDGLFIFLSNSGVNGSIYNKAKFLKTEFTGTPPIIISITAANTTNISNLCDYHLPGSRLLLISKKEYHLPTTSISIMWYIMQRLVNEVFLQDKNKNLTKIRYM